MGALLGSAAPVHAEPGSACAPTWVTAECIDPEYDSPVIDEELDSTDPVPHHKVSGHFAGTDKKFTFYFPPRQHWEGRFFQQVYPTDDEIATGDNIAFGADSGAYTVQTNGGGGFRVDAAAAKFSKTVAARYYGTSDRIYGYIWGGSGGSYQTIGGMESSAGVWDGAVPFIVGVPTSIPGNFFIRELARLVLQDTAPAIADAVGPGGSGDPYAVLDDTERAVLTEVTEMGVPLQAWEDYSYVLGISGNADARGLLGFAGAVQAADPTYAQDFWSRPGYLGTEQSPLGEEIRAAVVDHSAVITRVDRDEANTPTRLSLGTVPANPKNTALDFGLYGPDGATRRGALSGTLDPDTKQIRLGSGNDPEVLRAIDTGATVRIDNRWPLALAAYPRHQVPREPGFPAFDHYRGADGKPRYPQRPPLLGPTISTGVTGGSTHTGKINGKVIAVGNLLDTDAFPWHGDWYRTRVEQTLGAAADNSFRLWYNDNADHIAPGRTHRLVDYTGILQQALRDVSAWAETGRPPAPTTEYDIDRSRIHLPADASERHGIQPVVHVSAGGANRIEVTAGQQVTLDADITIPAGTGTLTRLEWDPAGTGEFIPVPLADTASPTARISRTFTYDTPGTYFPALRATSHRNGDPDTPFAAVQNLGRARVVVR